MAANKKVVAIINPKIREIDRITLMAMKDVIQVGKDQKTVLNDLFDYYRNKIEELLAESNEAEETWPLLQEIINDDHFKNTSEIQDKAEYSRRIGKISNIIENYLNR